MAKFTAQGRVGRIRFRVQSFNSRIQRWVEINTKTGEFMNVKADSIPFKAVRRTKQK